MATDKDTIYIDIDDEITGIIDKLKASQGKVVALVLPKRASVFQSVVNMKLLKRAAQDVKKHLVLITSEAGLLPLAGAAGIHVAKTLTSKPEIPSGPDIMGDDMDDIVDEPAEAEEHPVSAETDGDIPIGKLAGLPATGKADGVETVELPDDGPAEPAAATAAKTASSKPPKDKNLQVPNFERFRKWLVLGGIGLVLLIFLMVLAFNVLPKATIHIATNAVSINSSLNLNLSTTARQLDPTNGTIPAKLVTQQKTSTQQTPATGQKNNGNKAGGTVTLTNCSGADTVIPGGTGVSSGGNTYIVQTSVTVPDSNYTILGKCKNDGKADVQVLAQNGGSSYNLSSGANFTVAGHPSITGVGQTISGGTDNIVKVVSQGDIDSAKSKISIQDNDVKQALQKNLEADNYFAVLATFSGGTPTYSTSANAGDAASSVTVTATVNYTMFGVREDDLNTLIDENVKGQINTSKQAILSRGLDKATFNVSSQNDKSAQVTLTTEAAVGPDIDTASIAREAAGKKPGAVKSELETNPDVTGVSVKLSPFWVTSVPKKTSKIHVTIEKPRPAAKAGANN